LTLPSLGIGPTSINLRKRKFRAAVFGAREGGINRREQPARGRNREFWSRLESVEMDARMAGPSAIATGAA
jgi:hypothetical protein